MISNTIYPAAPPRVRSKRVETVVAVGEAAVDCELHPTLGNVEVYLLQDRDRRAAARRLEDERRLQEAEERIRPKLESTARAELRNLKVLQLAAYRVRRARDDWHEEVGALRSAAAAPPQLPTDPEAEHLQLARLHYALVNERWRALSTRTCEE
ncbi:hypothetical protein DIPPA_19387 [Diplonema papillatum]|nr:hypothetical protein DIPPA_19387 [Diplonema papillatum]